MPIAPKILQHHRPKKSCPGCPFRGPKVGSKGNPKAPIVFIAESPGNVEVKTMVPLTGPSGKVFHDYVPEATPNGPILILNAMECCPPTKLKDEKRMMVAHHCCHDRLMKQIKKHPRRIIIAMGNSAVRSITGNDSLKITKIRGRLIPSNLAELGIFPIVHIAALMRGTGSFRQWREDIQYAYELGSGASPREHLKAEVKVISSRATKKSIARLFRKMMAYGNNKLTCDIETSSLYPHECHEIKKGVISELLPPGRILSVGVTPDNDKGISYCFFPEQLKLLKPYLQSKKIKWAYHNGKFDVKFLKAVGINARVDDDTMLMSYALDENGGVHDLEQVSGDVLDAPDYKYMIQPYLPNKSSSYELIPPDVLAEYQAIDTSNTAQLRPILRERIRRDPTTEKLYTKTLIPASSMLTQVEINGIQVDKKRVMDNDKFFGDMLEDITGKIHEYTGIDFNIGSPEQVANILFNHLKFRRVKRGKERNSTDKGVLEKLFERTEDPLLPMILKHRTAVKMHGTYVKGLLKWIGSDGRIHSNYLIHGTRTGRLSSREPNMQNPPRLAQIRGSFIAATGYEIMEVDLSQAELRSLANLSNDPVLCALYNEDGDLHTDLANFLYPGWDTRKDKELKKEQRVKCKNVNFGIVYGISGYGLQDQIGGTIQDANDMISGWFERYEVAGKFINKCRKQPSYGNDIITCFGRKKRVGIVTRENLPFLQNEAANFPHQSIASDITLHTAIRRWRPLLKMGVKIVNLVHDSIIMEVPISKGNSIRRRVAQMVTQEMEQVPRDWGIKRVPFVADAEVGHRWGSLEKYNEWKEAA